MVVGSMNTVREICKNKNVLSYIYLTVFYTLIHGFLILNQSFFWDDWIWVLNPNEFRTALGELGVVFFKPFFYEIFKQPIFVIRSFVFLNYFIAALFFYKSLLKIFSDNHFNILFCSLIFIAMPYNIIGRSSLCTMPYSLSFALFFMGYFSYLKFRMDHLRYMFFVSILFFTLSFNTTSILVLYAAVMFLTEFLFFEKSKRFIKKLILLSVLIVLHTALFYVIKINFFPTSGVYATYNKLSFNLQIIYKLVILHGPFYFFEPLIFSALGKDLVSSNVKTVMILGSVSLYSPLLWSIYKKDLKSFLWIMAAIILILSALFPYVIVGKQPYTYNWDSRHQLLIPMGAAVWFLIVFNFFKNIQFRTLLYSLLLICFSFGTVRMYLSVQGLRYQDLALQRGLLQLTDVSAPASYLLLNRESSPGMMNHEWNFYELTGMLYQKTGRQINPVILASHYGGFKDPELWVSSLGDYKARYMLKEAQWKPPFYCIKLSENHHMSEWQALKYLFEEYFGSDELFNVNIEKIYKFKKNEAETKDNKPTRC
jgi:hypothetical protein